MANVLALMPISQCRGMVRRMAMPVVWVLAFFYLGFHTFHGERGLYAVVREEHELHVLKKQLASTKAEREALELKVSRLRDESLDLDLLDEQTRRMLGVSRPGEVMVIEKN